MANLAALLEKEASAEIEAVRSEAQQRASEILAKAQAEADAIVAARTRTILTQHESTLVRARSSAQLEAASLKLRAQHEAVEEVYRAAHAELDALTRDPKRYELVLKALYDEALDVIGAAPGATLTVTVHPTDRALAERLFPRATVATDESVRGGVRLKATGRNTVVENTLFGRLEALRDELASEVASTLLGNRKVA